MATALLASLTSACVDTSTDTSTKTSLNSGQKPYYTEYGSRVIPGLMDVLRAPPEGAYDADTASQIDIPPPIEADITKDPAARTPSYANRLTFSPAEYVAAGGRDPTDNSATCQTFPEAAKQSLTAALNIWGSLLNSSQPVTVRACWRPMGWTGLGVLAQAAPGSFDNITLNGRTVWAPAALANAIHKRDLDPTRPDIVVSVNSSAPWHTNPNIAPTRGLNDLTTALLHELGHGLGFLSDANTPTSSNPNGRWVNFDSIPFAFDSLLRDANGRSLTDTRIYPNNSRVLGDVFRSNNMFFVGSRSMAANGNQAIRIHPSDGEGAMSHMHTSTFRGTINQLMTTELVAPGLRNHNPGPIAIAMLQDMGWGLVSNTPPPAIPAFTAMSMVGNSTLSTPTYTWGAVAAATTYRIRLINRVNNSVLMEKEVASSAVGCAAGNGSCSYRDNALRTGSYAWSVQAVNSAGSSQWTANSNFSIGTLTPPPVAMPLASQPLTPTGIAPNRSPAYVWRAAATSNDYYLQILNRANNAAAFQGWVTASVAGCSSGGGNCTFKPNNNNLAVGNYTWRVISRNSAGNGPSSSWMNFTIT